MELNSFEIKVLVGYYENELARLEDRLDTICRTANDYDQDLRDEQIHRIKKQKQSMETRIKELQNIKEMD